MRKLKLIWDFRGPECSRIAEHHAIHLKEYANNQTANVFMIDHEMLHELHAIAFMVVDEADMKLFRDSLKPHRGQWVENNIN